MPTERMLSSVAWPVSLRTWTALRFSSATTTWFTPGP